MQNYLPWSLQNYLSARIHTHFFTFWMIFYSSRIIVNNILLNLEKEKSLGIRKTKKWIRIFLEEIWSWCTHIPTKNHFCTKCRSKKKLLKSDCRPCWMFFTFIFKVCFVSRLNNVITTLIVSNMIDNLNFAKCSAKYQSDRKYV